MKTIKYWLRDEGETEEDARELTVPSYNNWELLAEVVAEDFYSMCDGCESRWPVSFTIRVGDVVRKFKVDREVTPEFSAKEEQCESSQ